jgi:hypothetical protein
MTTPKPERKISLDAWAVALAFAFTLFVYMSNVKVPW